MMYKIIKPAFKKNQKKKNFQVFFVTVYMNINVEIEI